MKKQGELEFLPLNLPVMLGFEKSGKWYAIDSVKGKLKIANNEDGKIEPISFLELARMIAKKNFCYIYPDKGADERICEILCGKDEMLEIIKDNKTNVYCIDNDRTYQLSRNSIYTNGERVSTDAMPDSLYVIDPRMCLQIKSMKDRVYQIRP